MASRRAKVKRAFGEISLLPSGRFRARYTGPDGSRHSAPITFVARIDAEGWLVDQERLISRGEWRPPTGQLRHAPLLMGEYAPVVVARRRLRPATAALYAKLLRLEILPTWADRALDDITAAEIATWYAGMQNTPTQQANAYGLLKSIFKEAIEGGTLEANPCRVKAGAQKQRASEIEVLTVDQLNRYLAAIPEARRVPLLLAGWCGLRSGEVRGLRVRDLDLDVGVVHVRQAVVRLKGQLLIGPPKTNAGIRSVAIPPHLVPALRAWADRQPTRGRDALLFPAGDGHSPLNDSVLRDAHDKGKAAIDMPRLTIHGLRHTSATLAAQLGATLAELQARIGHSTPNMAMRYQHVAAERDAQLAARMSAFATGGSRWTAAEPRSPD
jgi:integrase